MELQGNILLKSFALGLILGYFTGYFLRKGIKTLLILAIIGILLVYISGYGETLPALWSQSSGFIIRLIKGTTEMLIGRLETYLTGNAWIFGFIAGFWWSTSGSK